MNHYDHSKKQKWNHAVRLVSILSVLDNGNAIIKYHTMEISQMCIVRIEYIRIQLCCRSEIVIHCVYVMDQKKSFLIASE